MNASDFGHTLPAHFLKFILIGAVGTGAHFSTLAVAVSLFGADPVWGSQVGACVGAVINYGLNRSLNYRETRSHIEVGGRFATVVILGFILNGLCMAFLIRAMGLNYLVAQCAATLIVLMWNFLANHLWTFRTRSQ